MEKIDFVVTWVDGNDPEWFAEKQQYQLNETGYSTAVNRFRDWGLMRYWFRGVEKFAPWVNNVYFITCGHYPEWLNLEHPKLKFVKHLDYIPQECLPTYNSNVIELHLHNIPELTEQFVLFNDDMLLINHTRKEDFFRNGLPCDTVRMGTISAQNTEDIFPFTLLNNSAVLNKHFSKREVIRKYWRVFFSPKYGMDNVRNLLLLPFNLFSTFNDLHLPSPHLKSSFIEILEEEPELLRKCAMHRFRTKDDVNHWLLKAWRYCKGQVVPQSCKWGKCFSIGHDQDIIDAIQKQKYKAICLNDSDPNLDFERHQKELIDAFETILPDKCSFEK